jgi:hypothetical protein
MSNTVLYIFLFVITLSYVYFLIYYFIHVTYDRKYKSEQKIIERIYGNNETKIKESLNETMNSLESLRKHISDITGLIDINSITFEEKIRSIIRDEWKELELLDDGPKKE